MPAILIIDRKINILPISVFILKKGMRKTEFILKSKNELKQDMEKCKRMFREFKTSIHTINDKLTAIQGATENIWEEIDKKNFYITQQIETIIRSVDTVSLHVENMEKAIAEKEIESAFENTNK